MLFALPALLSQGLLKYLDKHFTFPKGFYTVPVIFIFLAFITLARLKFLEHLKYSPPGEWGKLIGLDRCPEVRTLREKILHLSAQESSEKWNADLCHDWMTSSPDEAGVLYVDGHVRVYHGRQTKLPKHYIARDKLCARATCDYWINAFDGKPFFYINKAIDPGLLSVLENDIVPRLEQEVPHQPSEEELAKDPLLPRFTLVFDREGYSPKFIKNMWKKRIAVITYVKNPGDNWETHGFQEYKEELCSGNKIELILEERGTLIGTKKDKTNIWVREIRRLRSTGKQGSIISTNFKVNLSKAYSMIVSRWSQENFFAYMSKEFMLNRLVDYRLEEVSDTIRVINHEYRMIDSSIRKLRSLMSRKKAEFASISLDGELKQESFQTYEHTKAKLLDELQELNHKHEELKKERRKHKKYVTFKDLPEDQKFQQLATKGKYLVDTVKMIAYRAETAMATILREKVPDHAYGTSRSLLKALFTSSVDLVVNQQNKTLVVKLHHMANPCTDLAIQYLCEELTATKTIYPGTDLQIVYEMIL